MSVSRVEVWLWGRHVASLAAAADGRVTFRYTPEFTGSGIELAPLLLPLSDSIHTGFDRRSNETFRGLPPLVVDSLPDRFGNALIRQYLAAEGRDPDSFTPLERLSTPLSPEGMPPSPPPPPRRRRRPSPHRQRSAP